MGARTSYLMDDADLEQSANQIKELVVGDLVKQGLLTDEQAHAYTRSRTVLLARKSRLGHGIMKLLGLDGDEDIGKYLMAQIDPD